MCCGHRYRTFLLGDSKKECLLQFVKWFDKPSSTGGNIIEYQVAGYVKDQKAYNNEFTLEESVADFIRSLWNMLKVGRLYSKYQVFRKEN